jgi:hypothetical protein
MTPKNISIHIGTLFPKSKEGTLTKFWYSKTDTQSPQYIHLLQKANEFIT